MFEWDYRNRLTSVKRYLATAAGDSQVFTSPSGANVTLSEAYTKHYVYNVYDQLIYEYRVDADTPAVKDNETVYIVQGGQRVAVLEKTAGSYDVTHLLLPDPTSNRMLAEQYINGATSHTIWPLHDQQGTVIAAISDDWLLNKDDVQHFEYDAYGLLKFDTVQEPSLANRLVSLHAGRDWDEVSDLYYNNARWYDPTMQRFISQDPLGFAAGDTNLYRYCGNSPTNATDPSGNKAYWEYLYGHDGWLGDFEGSSYNYFSAHPELAEWMANRTDTQLVGASVALAVPTGIGLFYGGSALVAAYGAGNVTMAGLGIYALKNVGVATVETAVEAQIAGWMGDDSFSVGSAFMRNFATDMAIGWMPGVAETKAYGKISSKLGRYALHYGSEVLVGTTADTAWSVLVEGRGLGASFYESLAGNMLGQGLGDAFSASIRRVAPALARAAAGRICFAAGTPVKVNDGKHAPEGFAAIESIDVGDHVATEAPAEAVSELMGATAGATTGANVFFETPRADVSGGTSLDCDGADWRKIVLRGAAPEDADIEVTLLRTSSWSVAMNAMPGRTIWVELPELNFLGYLQVLAVTDAPPVLPGPGLVTGTFRHLATELVEVRVEDLAEPIRSTPRHPFWSVTRGDWVEARDLQPGEELLPSGDHVRSARVRSVGLEGSSEQVYNIEVQGEHVYRVSSLGLLVHNASWDVKKHLLSFEVDAIGNKYPGSIYPGTTSITHAHHILPQIGLGREGKKLVAEANRAIRSYGLDPTKGVFNLEWAPNWGHPEEYCIDVAEAILEAEDLKNVRQWIAILQEMGLRYNDGLWLP